MCLSIYTVAENGKTQVLVDDIDIELPGGADAWHHFKLSDPLLFCSKDGFHCGVRAIGFIVLF